MSAVHLTSSRALADHHGNIIRTSFVFYEHDNLVFCPVTDFLALALADNAFLSPHIKSLGDVYMLEVPPHKGCLWLQWKPEMKTIPIF